MLQHRNIKNDIFRLERGLLLKLWTGSGLKYLQPRRGWFGLLWTDGVLCPLAISTRKQKGKLPKKNGIFGNFSGALHNYGFYCTCSPGVADLVWFEQIVSIVHRPLAIAHCPLQLAISTPRRKNHKFWQRMPHLIYELQTLVSNTPEVADLVWFEGLLYWMLHAVHCRVNEFNTKSNATASLFQSNIGNNQEKMQRRKKKSKEKAPKNGW